MKALAVLIGLIAVIYGWYYFNSESPSEPIVETVQVSPQKQFETLFESVPVDAPKLAILCQQYPQLAAQFLKNREFKIHGIIRDFRLTGIDGRRAEILLQTDTQKQLIVVFNLDQYFRLGLQDRTAGRYTIVDTELFWVQPNGTNKRLLFAKELEMNQIVATRSFGATNVSFLAVKDAPSVGIF